MRALLTKILMIIGLTGPVVAKPMELYIDADYSVSYAASEAIELGVRTALDEVNYLLGGAPVTLVKKDHRGNVKRSYRTMTQFIQSDTALAMIGGLHSPPYITHRDYMNENRVLTLLPWSAGAPITRAGEGQENWIFRVSVDDTKSGEFFVREALERQGCTSLALVLLDTGWGRAGENVMRAALSKRNASPATVQYFKFTVGEAAAGALANEIAASGADCAIMMANAGNGATVFRALHERLPDLRLFSHWGILGATFTNEISHQMREALDLQVLQTCALAVETAGSAILADALRRAAPGAGSLAEIGAVTGFVHGYDMTRILISAAAQASSSSDWPDDVRGRRAAIKAALEDLQTPVEGILKRYDRPFRAPTPSDNDAHEALGLNDLCIARFREDGLLQDAG